MKITIEITPDEICDWSHIDEIDYNNIPLIIERIMSGFAGRERTEISSKTVMRGDRD